MSKNKALAKAIFMELCECLLLLIPSAFFALVGLLTYALLGKFLKIILVIIMFILLIITCIEPVKTRYKKYRGE